MVIRRSARRPTVVRRPFGRVRVASTLLSLVLAATAAAALLAPGTAAADPIVPPNANATVRALALANARAADANESAMGAREQLAVRQREADRTRRDSAATRVKADRARAEKNKAFVGVDRLTRAAYQGGQLDPLSALLGSDSPQSYLDKVSLLDTVSVESQSAVQRFTDAAAVAENADRDANARAVDADRAASDARRTATEADLRKAEADRDVAVANAALRRASSADRAALRSGGVINFPTAVGGSGIAIDALRMALTQQGKDYVWGATGPSTFDCSGLVQWAYRQVGIGMPRVSSQQALVGQEVAPPDARPGDLLFFNNPVSHVGIYVGGGKFLEAPQSGDVVKVSTVRSNLSGIRRVSM